MPGTISLIVAPGRPADVSAAVSSAGVVPSERVMWTESPKGSALPATTDLGGAERQQEFVFFRVTDGVELLAVRPADLIGGVYVQYPAFLYQCDAVTAQGLVHIGG